MNPTRERLAASRVLVVGDAMLDRYWFGAVERISPEAPVPVVRVEREEERLGGAANVALNVRSLGSQVALMSVIGDDTEGARMMGLLARAGVRARVSTDARLRTIVKLRVIGRAQQLLRVDFDQAPPQTSLVDMLGAFEQEIRLCDAVLFSDYAKGGLSHLPRMIELARAAGKPVLVDPKGNDYERYRGASVITPNRAELAQAVGGWSDEETLKKRAFALREQIGVAALLVTRAEEGMTLFDGRGALHVPTQAQEVFDVTGAGDTVIATLAAMLAAGVKLRSAVEHANKAAGIVVSRFGTASVTYEELFE
jgi:D-glycero-beta-D-manno-heptose-7-phosphate kinase